jgi:hypothetical protein
MSSAVHARTHEKHKIHFCGKTPKPSTPRIPTVRSKVKLSRHRPGQVLGVPGGSGSRISRQLAHKVVSPTHRPSLPQESIPGTHFCYRLSRPQGHNATGRLKSLKNSSDSIGNRTRDLPAWSVLPQPNALPRTPRLDAKIILKRNLQKYCDGVYRMYLVHEQGVYIYQMGHCQLPKDSVLYTDLPWGNNDARCKFYCGYVTITATHFLSVRSRDKQNDVTLQILWLNLVTLNLDTFKHQAC